MTSMKRACLGMVGVGVVLLLLVLATEVRQQRQWHEAVAIRHLGFTNGPDLKRQAVLLFTNGSRSTIYYVGAASAEDSSGKPIDFEVELGNYQSFRPGASAVLLLSSPAESRPWHLRLACSRFGLQTRLLALVSRFPWLGRHLPARWRAERFEVIESDWIQ